MLKSDNISRGYCVVFEEIAAIWLACDCMTCVTVTSTYIYRGYRIIFAFVIHENAVCA